VEADGRASRKEGRKEGRAMYLRQRLQIFVGLGFVVSGEVNDGLRKAIKNKISNLRRLVIGSLVPSWSIVPEIDYQVHVPCSLPYRKDSVLFALITAACWYKTVNSPCSSLPRT
jgi:hypothetical protein